MSKFIDLTGKRFAKLTVIKYDGVTSNNQSMWICKCDCGNTSKVMYGNLKNGSTKSCGCLRKEKKVKNNQEEYYRIFNIFYGIKGRCYNPNNPAYKNYGGRGIRICDEWLQKNGNGLRNFYKWAINNGYNKNLTIDRIDVNGNYEPSNCRWATPKEQSNNKRNNHIINYKGKKYTLSQLSNYLNIKITTLKWRLEHGWKENELGMEVNLANKYIRSKED